jgi:hypothetical protein
MPILQEEEEGTWDKYMVIVESINITTRKIDARGNVGSENSLAPRAMVEYFRIACD